MTLPKDFAHLAAFFVYGKAVCEQSFVRSPLIDGTACEKRRVEPSSVLVAAFEVQVSGIAKLVSVDPLMRRSYE